MEYGMKYLSPKKPEDDTVSILSAHAAPSYEPYHTSYSRDSIEDNAFTTTTSPFQPSPLLSHSQFATQRTGRSARSVSHPSPVSIAQSSVPPQHSQQGTEAALFENRAVLNRPYLESVAYQNVTPFQPAQEHGPKPDYEAIAYNAEDRRPPSYGAQQYVRPPRRIMDPWRPGNFTRFPVWGVAALLVVLAFTGLSVGILLASDNDHIDNWQVTGHNIQPAVYLSAFALVMDSLTAFALAEGLVVRFWTQAMRGAFLAVLDDIFESGYLWGALRRTLRLRFNMVAVACLLAAFSAIRGPLFQRASTISADATIATKGTIDIPMASTPLVDYFESATTDPQVKGIFTPELAALVRNFSAGVPFPYNTTSCSDNCTANIKGIGFKVNCTTNEQSFDLNFLPEDCKTCSDKTCQAHCHDLAINVYNFNFFSVNYITNTIDGINSQDQSLTLSSVFKTEPTCAGNIQSHTCSLYQGTVTYPVTLTNGTIARSNPTENLTATPDDTTFNNSTPLDPAFMTKYWPTLFQNLFPPIAVNVSVGDDFKSMLYFKCFSPSSGGWAPAQGNVSDCSGIMPLPLQDLSIRYATPQANGSADNVCNATWRDPMQDLVDEMQELAFRISVDMALANESVFAPGLSAEQVDEQRKDWIQTVEYRGWQAATVFRTNGTYVALGVVVSLLGVLAILPLYYGWWELGRKTSLNPLEVGRAFGAPVLDGLDGNAGATRVVAERGGAIVRYGVVERFGEEKKLRIELAGSTRAPWKGEVFG